MQKLNKFILVPCFCVLISGCTALDLLPWNHSEKPLQIDLPSDSMVTIEPSTAVYSNDISVEAGIFPFEAPSLRFPAPRLEVNHEVRRELALYLRNNAHGISDGLARQEKLFPVLEKIFRDEGLPNELLNLALIESGFREDVSSPAGAVGMWQFMNGTAKLYGLKVSHKIDERRDPILSTIAAARHLKDLYAKFNDWYLVLAAYNAGEGCIDRASTGFNKNDYWAMVRAGNLSNETARFVPKFIASSILQKLYHRYGPGTELAMYVDRHLVALKDAGPKMRYAFMINADSAVSRG